MEWSDLRIFLAVAREGTLGAAARKLGQSQPTMGRRLRALEQAVGQTLFQRTDSGFVLTDEGSAVLAHAERIEEEVQAVERELQSREQHLDGTLRISSSDWFGIHMLTPVFAEFAQLQPRVVIEVLTDARLYSLPRREADLAFRITPFREPEVISRRLMQIEYGVYLKSGRKPPRPRRRRRHAADHHGHRVRRHSRCGLAETRAAERACHPRAAITATCRRNSARAVSASRYCRGRSAIRSRASSASTSANRLPAATPISATTRDLKRLARLRALLDLVIERLAN